jgi:hypothetical protein
MAPHFFTNIPKILILPLNPCSDCPFSLKHLEVCRIFSEYLLGTFPILAIVGLSSRLSGPHRGKQDSQVCHWYLHHYFH